MLRLKWEWGGTWKGLNTDDWEDKKTRTRALETEAISNGTVHRDTQTVLLSLNYDAEKCDNDQEVD